MTAVKLRLAPGVALAAGALVVALLAALVSGTVNAVVLDETLHKIQAVRYSGYFPGGFFDDPLARSTTRLYPLALAPIFVVMDGDEAIRAARVFSTLLFVSAALPAYLLAREVLASAWAAVAAGLLAVATPWLILTTVLYTENLAYPVFLWTVLAILRAMRRPSARADVLAVAAILAATYSRTQLICLAGVYLVLIGVRALRGRRAGTRPTARALLAEHPATAAVLALGLAGFVVAAVAGGPGEVLDRVLGPYRGITTRETAPGDLSLAVLIEVGAISLGMGVLPAALGALWLGRSLGDSRERAWWPALVFALCAGAVWTTAVFGQGGYLDAATEERYYFYAVPLLWIGALAAIEDRGVRARTVALASLPFIAVLGMVPLVVGLNPETEFLAPVLAGARHIGGRLSDGPAVFGVHDVFVGVALLVTVLGIVAWRRRGRALAGALAVAVVVQLGLTGYVFAAALGDVPDIPSRTGPDADQAWVDAKLDPDDEATIVRGGRMIGNELQLNFYNGSLSSTINAPGAAENVAPYPLFLLPSSKAVVGPDGSLAEGRLGEYALQDRTSSMLQFAGPVIASRFGGELELIRPVRPFRVRWAANVDPDGSLPRPVEIFVAPPADRKAVAVTIEAAGVEGAPTSFEVKLGDQVRTFRFPAAAAPLKAKKVRLTACGPTVGLIVPLRTAPRPPGPQIAGTLGRVEVRETGDTCRG